MSTNVVAGSVPTNFATATSHTITVRETLAGASNSPRDTVLTINVTAGTDTTPNAFTFTDQTGVALSTPITSNTITVSGINTATPLTITGGQYSINGGAFASTATTVVNGDTVVVRVTSSGSNSTAVNATLTIGGVSDTFTVTTLAGAAWTPLDLGSKLMAYYDTKLSTITGTAPVTQVNDLSGNGYHLTEGGTTAGPAYNATGFGAGKPSLDFDGSNDRLLVSGASLGGTGFACAAIATLDTSGSGDSPLASISDSAQPGPLWCFYQSGASTSLYTFRQPGLDSGPLTVTSNTRFRAYTRFNGTDNVLTINGSSAAAVANTAAFDATVSLGMGQLPNLSAAPWKGKIGVLIFIKGVLTTGEETNLDTWLTAW